MTVDDHPALRDGIASIIEHEADMTLVGEAANGAEAIATYEQSHPDVTLMDLQMPIMDGLEAIARIRAISPSAHIIVLTTYEGDVQAVQALKAGASSYLLKSALRRELLDAIRAVHAGRRYLPASVAQEIAIHSAEESLTQRELTVLQLVAEGKANKVIAWELSISDDTVKAHLRSIFAKLDVNDRTHAVTAALRRGAMQLR
ncbi:response regulator transcription factor [Polymorphobacter sp. PAMC 29334]|uniref:response regulator n=1 Tax=Polymorphobacter sp. PAMC 29334 TaxID=2862331 RepID=UPI0021040E91|nr:response regulator transcription factor [Polymorphobacter sp. PAMC 29334]